ncbi:hypothetical protein BIW11_04807, partial [Tropilaelaps mercedesae]
MAQSLTSRSSSSMNRKANVYCALSDSPAAAPVSVPSRTPRCPFDHPMAVLTPAAGTPPECLSPLSAPHAHFHPNGDLLAILSDLPPRLGLGQKSPHAYGDRNPSRTTAAMKALGYVQLFTVITVSTAVREGEFRPSGKRHRAAMCSEWAIFLVFCAMGAEAPTRTSTGSTPPASDAQRHATLHGNKTAPTFKRRVDINLQCRKHVMEFARRLGGLDRVRLDESLRLKRLTPFGLMQSPTQGLQSILNSFDIRTSTIIRTNDSLQAGAKYLNERQLRSSAECSLYCWEVSSCNVAVFEEKSNGACYLFDCGTPENFGCQFTPHEAYTVALLTTRSQHESELVSLKHAGHGHGDGEDQRLRIG